MGIWLASKTLKAIDDAIVADGGNAFRRLQGQVLPHIEDAYREDKDEFRSHLGASLIGGKCERAIWYGFRWALKKAPRGKKRETSSSGESRMRRLWNRGHLEEGRFIAMLLMIGVQVYQQDAEGKQYRISAFGGHFGGAGDGILIGVPDLPPGIPCLGEFKTHSNKSFEDLVSFGVREAKPEHYVQMQEYMHHFGLMYALYVAVNKDNDELHSEIIMYDRVTADKFLDRAKRIIFDEGIPRRMSGASPGFHICKHMCDFTDVCFSTVPPARNCRTCQDVKFHENGMVLCENNINRIEADIAGWEDPIELDKEAQVKGCEHYTLDLRLR